MYNEVKRILTLIICNFQFPSPHVIAINFFDVNKSENFFRRRVKISKITQRLMNEQNFNLHVYYSPHGSIKSKINWIVVSEYIIVK